MVAQGLAKKCLAHTTSSKQAKYRRSTTIHLALPLKLPSYYLIMQHSIRR
jgi:hypothetical protein